MSDVWVLIKLGDDDTIRKVMAVYTNRDALDRRIERIAKANPQYPMIQTSPNSWRIGPERDEGFFGNKPFTLAAIEAPLKGS